MRKILLIPAVLCSVLTTGMAAEKPDYWLLLMLDSGDGRTQNGDQMVTSKTCDFVAETFSKAETEKVPFTLELSTNPKVAGEVLVAVCITPNGDVNFLTGFSPDSRINFGDFSKFSEYITKRVNELRNKP